MNNLRFDSLQKFLVSLGVLLIIGPPALLYAWGTRDIGPIISVDEYNNLSTYSREMVDSARVLNAQIPEALKAFWCIGVLCGIYLLYIGFRGWANKQEIEDRKLNEELRKAELETLERKFALRSRGLDESDQREIFGENLSEGPQVDGSSNPPYLHALTLSINSQNIPEQLQIVREAKTGIVTSQIDAEDILYDYLKEKMDSQEYLLAKNVKSAESDTPVFDIVALSTTDAPDKLYSVCFKPLNPEKEVFLEFMNKERLRGEDYKNTTHKEYIHMIAIITLRKYVTNWVSLLRDLSLTKQEYYLMPSLYVYDYGHIEEIDIEKEICQ